MSRDSRRLLTLESTHRLTPSISLHRFSCSVESIASIRPSQFITLQFGDDLDPIGGARNLNKQDRCLSFTPCRLYCGEGGGEVSLLAKNGRVTGLIGLPRPNGPLKAELIDAGGGFDQENVDLGQLVCIAGGTGISCFAAMEARPQNSLLCSIRAEDFDLVVKLIKLEILNPKQWKEVQLFITASGEVGSLGGKPVIWWDDHIRSLTLPDNVRCRLRRLESGDIDGISSGGRTVLFCGGISLEWQIRMWALEGAEVLTTWRADS